MLSVIFSGLGGLIGYKLGQYFFPVPPEVKVEERKWKRPNIMSVDQLRSSMSEYIEKDDRPLMEQEIEKVAKLYSSSLVGIGILKTGIPSNVNSAYGALMSSLVHESVEN